MKHLFLTTLCAAALLACQSEAGSKTSSPVTDARKPAYEIVELGAEQVEKIKSLRATAKAIDATAKPKESAAAWEILKTYMLTLYPQKHPEIALVDRSIAETLFYTGDIKGAAAAFESQIPIMERAGPEYGSELIGFYNNLGVAYNYLSRHEEARANAQKVLDYRKAEFSGSPHEELATAYNNLAASDMELALYDSAISNISEAIKIADALETPPPTAALWYANLPVYLRKAGRDDEAIIGARKAALKIETLLPPNHPFGANNLSNLGTLLVARGQLSEAERVTRKALDIATAAHGPTSEQAAAFQTAMAQILLAKGDTETARQFASAAQETLKKTSGKDTGKEILARQKIAQSYFQDSDYLKAVTLQSELVESWKKSVTAENRDLIISRDMLSDYLIHAKDYRQAKQVILTNKAAKSGLYADTSIDALVSDSRLHLIDSHINPEVFDKTSFKATYENTKTKDISQYLTAGSLSAKSVYLKDIFEALFVSAHNIKDDELSFQISRRMLASEAGNAVSKSQLRDSLTSDKSRQLLRDIQDLSEDKLSMDREYSTLMAGGDPDKLKAHQSEMTKLDAKLEGLTQNLLTREPTMSDLTSGVDIPIKQMMRSLSKDEAYLGYITAQGEVYAILLTQEGFISERLKVSPKNIRILANVVRDSLVSTTDGKSSNLPLFDKTGSHELYQKLFPARIEAQLSGKTELRIVSSHLLNDLPFAVLVDGRTEGEMTWLSDAYALSVAPSLGTTADKKRRKPGQGIRMVGVSGDFDIETGVGSNFIAYRSVQGGEMLKDLPPLPETKAEITSIAEALKPKSADLLSGAQSTEANFRTLDLSKIDIFAFATHGLMSGEIEGLDEPALVLNASEINEDAVRDGLLTASEISKFDLSADWVILSACNTASANDSQSGSYAGLTRAFLYAGADSLLVSHWPVRDDAAAFLTVNTVKNTQAGLSKAKALQTAMNSLRNNPDIPNASHPALWAPFVLVGQ